jgi:hypothetical protein
MIDLNGGENTNHGPVKSKDSLGRILKLLFCLFFGFTLFIFAPVTISPSVQAIAPPIAFQHESIISIVSKNITDTVKRTERPILLWIYINQNLDYFSKIPDKYRDFVINTAYDANKLPLWAICETFGWESGWNPKAFHKNIDPDTGKVWSIDRGIGQICSAYQDQFVKQFYKGDPKKFNVWNPYDNLQVSIYHLADLLKTFDGDWYKALAAYNGGMTMVHLNQIKPVVRKYSIRLLTKAGKFEYIPVVLVKKAKK